jgi:uncharacterized protein
MSTKEKKFKDLKKLSKNIIEIYKPEKIILFGSLASGRPRKESDIDLVVIKKTNKKFFARMDEIGIAINKAGIETAKDVIVFTPEEIKKKLFMEDYFIKDIINNGVVLYAKKN